MRAKAAILLPSAVTQVMYLRSFTSIGATVCKHGKVLREWIATTPKCATIGTVQGKYQASHGTGIFIHGPEVNSSGADKRQTGIW
jgi:hypothetical protein